MKPQDLTLPPEIAFQANALKLASIHQGPSQELLNATLLRLSSSGSYKSQARTRRRWSSAGAVGLAAAVLILLLGIPSSSVLSPATAFSIVQEKVKKADSVTCLAQYSLFGWHIETRVFLYGNRIRLEDQVRDYKGSLLNVTPEDQAKLTCIIDLQTRRVLTLNPLRKTGEEDLFDEATATSWANPIAQIRQMPPGNAQSLGKEEMGGKTVEQFVVHSTTFLGLPPDANCQLHVWVDNAKRLPVKIEVRDQVNNETLIGFTDFVWNQPQDEQKFQMKLPNGYALKKQGK